ncbi:gamma-glutamyl-gamma-aminobutyrate hydrolase family protein [uncultured Streptococcus sp.]|uniref:gamma-glutamyl-gamma-aminobutyrate hydrolase family protein n=1 Tax=uncultured Streptococcus sp. TaxID=83427 RepID=UPI0025984F9C|nr:gamma-glutamyl-gamma-aminobutyrate hydrolase family protein [uncultured Streptococcus sp.]
MTIPLIGITSNEKTVEEGSPIIHLSVSTLFADRVKRAGGLPFYIPISNPDFAREYVNRIDKLILSGGQNVDPSYYGEEKTIDSKDYFLDRDIWEVALVKEAIAQGKPVLGVCRGLQLYNAVTVGSLNQAIDGHAEKGPFEITHKIVTENGSQLQQIYGREQEVNSVHRQSLKKLAPHLKVTARSSKDDVIEGVESFTDAPFIGVQWHPEFLLGHKHLKDQGLFDYFVKSFT